MGMYTIEPKKKFLSVPEYTQRTCISTSTCALFQVLENLNSNLKVSIKREISETSLCCIEHIQTQVTVWVKFKVCIKLES